MTDADWLAAKEEDEAFRGALSVVYAAWRDRRRVEARCRTSDERVGEAMMDSTESMSRAWDKWDDPANLPFVMR